MKWKERQGMGKWSALLTGLTLVWAVAAPAASFDCAKAKSAVEKMICADAELSRLDEEMAMLYKQALQKNEKYAAAIRQEQKDWLKHMRNVCADVDCVRQAYLSRYVSLSPMMGGIRTYHQGANEEEPACQTTLDNGAIIKPKAALPAWGNKWVCNQSEHEAEKPLCHVCNDLVRWLNRHNWKNSQAQDCVWSVLASYPEFSDPPWEELDPEKHRDLLFNLEKYTQGYRPEKNVRGGPYGDSDYRDFVEAFIKHGGRLQVWRTSISAQSAEPTIQWSDATATKEHTLIRMSGVTVQIGGSMLQTQRERDKKTGKICKGLPHGFVRGSIFYVSSDLSGPDPDVNAGPFGDLKLYQGTPIFVYSNGIQRVSPKGLIYCCSFSFTQGGK